MHVCVCLLEHMYVPDVRMCLCISLCVCMCVFVCMCMCVSMFMFVGTNVCVNVFSNMYVWTVYMTANVWNVAIIEIGFLLLGQPGLQVDFGDDPSPMDIWSHIIDDDIVEHIRQETNEYAKSSIRDKQQ